MDEYALGQEILRHMETGDRISEELKKLHSDQLDGIPAIAAAEAMLVKIRLTWLKERYGPVVPELVMMIVNRLEGDGHEDSSQL